MAEHGFQVGLRLVDNYRFEVDFGECGALFADQAPPLGGGDGPNPEQLLGAAVGNCLAASLLFAIRKFKDEPGAVTAAVSGELERRDGRLRIAQLSVRLQLGNAAAAIPHLPRVLQQFEEFCTVTQSVRAGIPVQVTVVDGDGSVVAA